MEVFYRAKTEKNTSSPVKWKILKKSFRLGPGVHNEFYLGGIRQSGVKYPHSLWILHQENSPANTVIPVRLTVSGEIQHCSESSTPYSTVTFLCDFLPFLKLKRTLECKRFRKQQKSTQNLRQGRNFSTACDYSKIYFIRMKLVLL